MNVVRSPEIGNIVRRIARKRREKDRILIVWKEIGRRSTEKDPSPRKNIGSMRMYRKKIDKETETDMATETDNVTSNVNKKRTTVPR